jgi:hypothetical protein
MSEFFEAFYNAEIAGTLLIVQDKSGRHFVVTDTGAHYPLGIILACAIPGAD